MTVTIRELDSLWCKDESLPANDPAISRSAYEELRDAYCEKVKVGERPAYFCPVYSEGRNGLKAQGYVGLLQTRCGTQIEILPKILEDDELQNEEDVATVRLWLCRVLETLSIWPKYYPHANANTAAIRRPLLDELIGRFLDSVNALVKRGVRHRYQAQRSNERFLRGRLLIAENLRFNIVRRDRFFVEYDAFLIDRPANRLLRSALEWVKAWSRDSEHQRLCRELMFVFDDVPVSKDFRADLARCDTGRGMAHYQSPLAWARLILLRLSPLTTKGSHDGMNMLFPMGELFERYVTQQVRQLIRDPFTLLDQRKRHWLVKTPEGQLFQLKPDMEISLSGRTLVVLDAKWKRVISKGEANDYGLEQSDFYQMYAYGRKYLEEGGELFLIYPMTERFPLPLGPFRFEDRLTLHVVPFDMDTGQLEPAAQKLLLDALGRFEEIKGQAA